MRHRHPGKYRSRTPRGRIVVKRRPIHKVSKRKKRFIRKSNISYLLNFDNNYLRKILSDEHGIDDTEGMTKSEMIALIREEEIKELEEKKREQQEEMIDRFGYQSQKDDDEEW